MEQRIQNTNCELQIFPMFYPFFGQKVYKSIVVETSLKLESKRA